MRGLELRGLGAPLHPVDDAQRDRLAVGDRVHDSVLHRDGTLKALPDRDDPRALVKFAYGEIRVPLDHLSRVELRIKGGTPPHEETETT